MAGLLGLFGDGNQDTASQLKWYQNFLSNLMNTSTAAKQFGQDIFLNEKDNIYNRLIPNIDNNSQYADKNAQIFNGLLGDSSNPESAYNAFNFFGQDPSAMGLTPEMRAQLEQMGGIGGKQQGLGDLAGQVFAGGGYSDQSQNVFDQLSQFRQAGGSNDAMRNLAMQVIQGGGANPYSNFTVDKGTEALNRGGATSQSNSLMNFGQQGLESKGQTPWDMLALGAANRGLETQGFNENSNTLSGAGRNLLASGGRSGDNQFLAGRGREILGKDPLLSMESAAGMAADKAGSLFANNSQQNYEQAMKRGGGPAVRSGLQNQAVQEGEDEQLRAVGDAVTNARMGQQGLQLQQFGQGKDIMSEGMQNELARMMQGGNFTGQGEQAALQRMLGLTGLGNSSSDRALNAQQLYSQMLGQSGQLSNQNMATVGGLGMQGLDAANNKLNSGIQLLQNTQGNDLSALSQYMQNLGQQNQYALGAGGLANSGYAGAGQTANTAFGNNMQGSQFGLNRQQTQMGGFNNMLDRGLNQGNVQNDHFLKSLQPLQNTQNQGHTMYNNALSGQTGLFGGYGTKNAQGNTNQSDAIGGAIAGIMGAS